MRIRPYVEEKDFEYVAKWINDEKIHALWCGGLIPYPLTCRSFHDILKRNTAEWGDGAYVATEADGTAVGFFCYSIHTENNEGFLKLIVVDPEKRGTGCGRQMLELALKFAFQITGAEQVQLNVYSENHAARRCYERIGFVQRAVTEQALSYKGEVWNRYNLVISKACLESNFV